MKKHLLQYISDAISEICQDSDMFKLYSALVYNQDYLAAFNNENRASLNIQELSLHWTGENEEKYNSLKLLRMKAFGTI